jgi:hypothetical protein
MDSRYNWTDIQTPQVIAIRTFVDIFLSVQVQDYVMWLVMISQWSMVGLIVIVGSATAKLENHGPFCEQSLHGSSLSQIQRTRLDGVSDDWCWITSNYHVERIMCVFYFLKPPK